MIKKILNKFKKANVISENSSIDLETSVLAVYQKLGINLLANNILEIGSRDGLDSYRLSKLLNVDANNVFIIEANPECFNFITESYKNFNVINKAVFNQEGKMSFNYVFKENIGTSSLLDRNDNFYDDKSKKITIETITGKKALSFFKVLKVDFCKIDVEGATLEVLHSFEDSIYDFNFFHLECEHEEIWKGQKLYIDIKLFLESKGFIEYFFEYVGGVQRQSDSIWVNSKLVKTIN